ncbi:Uncharacterized protein AXF42_Ash021109 [Apostasia shenzhenica]|uniref:Uncharacterized protein n=1 Tax=Apostasia shenzhenica TaxID=1088818 RepID=A0A2H9ZWU5_9ASPA|nr:Uncharacterized protein AXF42_Ash021109 [Apostasia shenzhenica]
MSTAEATGGGKMLRRRSRLSMHAPASIQVEPPSGSVAEWNVAIPLLSPLDIVSMPTEGAGPSSDSAAVEAEGGGGDRGKEVAGMWRHPAEPFYYEPPPANAPPAFAVPRCR